MADQADNPLLKQERIGVGTVSAGDVVQVCFDHYGSLSGDGGVINVQMIGEAAVGTSFTENLDAPSLSESWQSYSQTFTISNTADVSGGITFQIGGVCGDVAGCGVSLNIDNLSIQLNP